MLSSVDSCPKQGIADQHHMIYRGPRFHLRLTSSRAFLKLAADQVMEFLWDLVVFHGHTAIGVHYKNHAAKNMELRFWAWLNPYLMLRN